MMAYLTMMAPRLIELHRVLKKTGIIFLHCDPSSSHYLKLLLDAVFEPSNFRNEIVWCYRQGGRGKKTFARKHDVLFFYSKSKNYKFYVDVVRIPYNGTGGFVTNNNGNVVRGKRYKPHPLGKIPKIGGIYLLLHLLLLEGANELARTNRYQFQLWALNLLGISSGKKGADGGIDGIRYFETGVSGELAKCIAQVKSGKISVKDIRELHSVLKREKATLGLLITLQPPTRAMITESASFGISENLNGKEYPVIQIVQIEELLCHKKFLHNLIPQENS